MIQFQIFAAKYHQKYVVFVDIFILLAEIGLASSPNLDYQNLKNVFDLANKPTTITSLINIIRSYKWFFSSIN
jgi:hypothetical protein